MTNLESASGRTAARPAASLEAAVVARRYYLDDKQKNEIADELGISRFKVARLLDEARASGIVRIYVDIPAELDLALGEAVARRFGIRRVIAAHAIDERPDAIASLVGAAAAAHLAGILGPADVLGMSWGRSLTYAVDAVTTRSQTDVVQLVGGVRAHGGDVSGMELVRRMAAKTGGQAFPLYAPLLVGSADMARELRADPSLADAISRFPMLTVAAVGIGSWQASSSALVAELTDAERRELVALGAAADVCAIVVDVQGQAIPSTILNRSVGISMDELRAIPEVVGVAGGADKASAIAAVLRGGTVNTLITDTITAGKLLEL